MTNLSFNIGFFNTLHPEFGLFGVGWDIQTIPFCPQTHKFPRSQRPAFAFEFSKETVVFGRVQWMFFVKVTGIDEIQILGQVFGLNMATEGIGVSKYEGAFVAIFGFEIVIVKLVHY